jgi:hypothetical protein
MDIGILNFHDADNYGAVLQAYALKECVKMNTDNCRVEIIDYKSKNILKGSKIIQLTKTTPKIFIKSCISNFLYLGVKLCRKYKFEDFRRNYLDISNRVFWKGEDICGYDIYVVGSDQVWNCEITGYDQTYFLSFCGNESKTIAYAASIGREKVTEAEFRFIKNNINNIDRISVREFSAVSLIEKITEKNVQHVLDPTLLVDCSVWDKLVTKKTSIRNYILLYKLSDDPNILEIAAVISEKLNMEVWYINDSIRKNKYGFKNIRRVGPIEFVELFRNASFVVTNSFHGTSFSILFRTNFVTIPHKTRGERMINLLRLLNLEDRLIKNSNQIGEQFKFSIDYSIPNEILKREKEKSLAFLINAIKD